MASWSDIQAAAIVLSQISDVTDLRPDGNIALQDIEVYGSTFSILDSLLKLSPELPDSERKKAARHAVTSCIRKSDLGVTPVLASIEAHERAYLAQKPRPFIVASTVSLQHVGKSTRVRFDGSTFTFSRSLPRKYRQPASLRDTAHYGPPPDGYAAVAINLRARCADSAMKVAMERLDLLRGLWNFARNFGSWRRSGGRADPVNGIVVGPIHTIHLPNGAPASDTYWWEPTYVQPIKPIDVWGDIDRLRKAERWVVKRAAASSYGGRLRQAFISYCRALDERDLNAAFVRLWGVLEDLTCVSEGESHAVVVRRATALSHNPAYERVALNRLRYWRNRMVHEGAGTSESELLTYDLKWYVEQLLRLAVRNSHRFRRWDHFCHFLDLPADPEDLQRRIAAEKLALRIRLSYRQADV